MIHKGNYGIVVVTEGKFKDRVGYYDDDEGPDAIVYFGRPFGTDYELIKRKHLGQGGSQASSPAARKVFV